MLKTKEPTDRQARFHRLAESLAIVLQHPATPEHSAHILGQIVQTVAHQAGIAQDDITGPRPNVARMDARAAFLEFGLAVAEAIDDDSLDTQAFNEIVECSNEIEDLLKPENVRERQAARLRGIMSEYALCNEPSSDVVFIEMVKAGTRYANHPETPKSGVQAMYALLSRIRELLEAEQKAA